MRYIKNINEKSCFDFQNSWGKYNCKIENIFCYVGNNGKIYITLQKCKVICLTVDWHNNCGIINMEILDFGENFDSIWFIQPMGEKYLIDGKYKKSEENIKIYGGENAKYRNIMDKNYRQWTRITIEENEKEYHHKYEIFERDNNLEYYGVIPVSGEDEKRKYKYITDSSGNVIRKIFLGSLSFNSCIVDSKKRIIAGYHDQSIFEDGRTRKGLIIYDEFGNKLWENTKYDIINCYDLDIDESENIWFYPDNKIVKIDSKNNYNIYDTGVKGCMLSRGFLFDKTQSHFIFENPSNTHIQKNYKYTYNFVIKDFVNGKFINEKDCIFMHDNKSVNIYEFIFKQSKVLLWNNDMMYWLYFNE